MRSLLIALTLLALTGPSVQQGGFILGEVIGAGIALEGAGIGYAIGHRRRHNCCYGGGGYGGGGYYGRRRRALAASLPAPLQQQQDRELTERVVPLLETAELDAYFRLVAAEDGAGCGLRLVCELGAETGPLDDGQKSIAALFGASGAKSLSADSPKHVYDSAYELGASGGSAEACERAFAGCGVNGRDLLRAAREARRRFE